MTVQSGLRHHNLRANLLREICWRRRQPGPARELRQRACNSRYKANCCPEAEVDTSRVADNPFKKDVGLQPPRHVRGVAVMVKQIVVQLLVTGL